MHAYDYGSPAHDAFERTLVSERGPPFKGYVTTYDVVDPRPKGSALPDEPTAHGDASYDNRGRFVQRARVAATTSSHPGAFDEGLSSLQLWRVAANGAATGGRALLGNADDVVVLGRQADTAVAKGWGGHVVLDTPNWSLKLNDEFISGAIEQGRKIYLAGA